MAGWWTVVMAPSAACSARVRHVAGGTTAQMEMSSPLVGRPAAPFELPDADGRLHRLDEYRGRWLLLVMHRHLF